MLILLPSTLPVGLYSYFPNTILTQHYTINTERTRYIMPTGGGEYDGVDPRLIWLTNHVRGHFKNIKIDKLSKFLASETCLHAVYAFLEKIDTRLLLFSESGNGALNVSTTLQANASLPFGSLYLIKMDAVTISMDNITRQVLIGDVPAQNALLSMDRLMQIVYLPLIINPRNQTAWTELVTKDVTDTLHKMLADIYIVLGQTRGDTYLPLPPNVENDDVLSPKEKMHVIEGSIITWTNLIKEILKKEPEDVLNKGDNPGPIVDVKFWENQAHHLNSVFKQLQSERIRAVLKFLDTNKSTYNSAFAKLCKEVFKARTEACDNRRYLKPLYSWFLRLENETDLEKLIPLFRPIIHMILSVWKQSKFYNKNARLVTIMQEISNAVIRQCRSYVDGKFIFEAVENEQTSQAVTKILLLIDVLGHFKSVYFDYKAKANAECPRNPWRVQNGALFIRLDAFLERCHDVLDLTQTIVQFSTLAKAEIGGTKGKTLGTSVAQIYSDFVNAVNAFKKVAYDVLDIDAKQFDDDYFSFRSTIKELERRLISVLVQGFDNATTLDSKFKILESFEGLLQRPSIRDEIKKKHVSLVETYSTDLKVVQNLFFELKSSPPISDNLPPTAGALNWSRGLLDRIKNPLDKLRECDETIMDLEQAKDAVKVYTNLVANFSEFERNHIDEWSAGIEKSSKSKLKLPILVRDTSSNLLTVNFDPGLIRLLREVKYFILLSLEVPDSAIEIYRKAEVFRRYVGNLELIVKMYNNIELSLLTVERPLLAPHIGKCDKALQQGIEHISWKNHGIDQFITECTGLVKDADDIIQAMKLTLKNVEVAIKSWLETPLMKRQSKPLTPSEFEEYYSPQRAVRCAFIGEGGNAIHSFLKETNKQLKVSQGLPDWKSYVDFINNVVINGLSEVVQAALQFLYLQIDAANIEKSNIKPLLEIELDLYGNNIVFIPSVGESSTGNGVRDIVIGWIDSFLSIGKAFRRIDTPTVGSYYIELQSEPKSKKIIDNITKQMVENEQQCEVLRKSYLPYSYLWTTDLNKMFQEFLEGAYMVDGPNESDVDSDAEKEEGSPANMKKKLDLSKFDERITFLRKVQEEIASMRHSTDISFLRISSQPVKQALSAWVTKWVYVFTSYLTNHIHGSLNNLFKFFKDVDAGLSITVGGQNKQDLIEVMQHIRNVRSMMNEQENMFPPIRSAVALLIKHGIALDDFYIGEDSLLSFLDNAPRIWDQTINKTFKKKEEILSLQNQTAGNIKTDSVLFLSKLDGFREEFMVTAPFLYSVGSKNAYHKIDEYNSKLAALNAEARRFSELENLFELPITSFAIIKDTAKDLTLLKATWDVVSKVESKFESWMTVKWVNTEVDLMTIETQSLLSEVQNLPKNIQKWNVYEKLYEKVMTMTKVLPIVGGLKEPSIKDRHWKGIMGICQKSFDKSNETLLSEIFGLKLHLHINDISEICDVAGKESKVEKKLTGIEETWRGMYLQFVNSNLKNDEVKILGSCDNIIEALEDNQVQLQGISGMGKSIEYFREKISYWQGTLGDIESALKVWLIVQAKWSSLVTIFLNSQDIRQQLPQDTKRFESVHGDWKSLMSEAQFNTNCVMACTVAGRTELLKGLVKELEICQKSLDSYLEVKRGLFPRFYFLSVTALLEILANGDKPATIMPHLGYCFEGIDSIDLKDVAGTFSKDGKVLTPNSVISSSMTSKDGEIVPFLSKFDVRGAVEFWLNELTKHMQQTLEGILDGALAAALFWDNTKDESQRRDKWLLKYPAQVVLLAMQVMWTDETTNALEEFENGSEDAVKLYVGICEDRLAQLIKLVQGDLPQCDRDKIIAMITFDVHNRDVVAKLTDQKVEGPSKFAWQSQLRAYWNADTRACSIKLCDFSTAYSYEYFGNVSRLVITPLTDRCYISLTMALRLILGGAPAGPAGTGKTETTKDLAKAVGLPCYVFNCSDQMNYQTMADIFKGLSQTGAWGCFDEFNRINIEVLSVVATQVKTVLDAIRYLSKKGNREPPFDSLPEGQPPMVIGRYDFFGQTIKLVPTVGFFITMNPGYAGRTELPENLKVLFRSCAMIRPDLIPICENMLMSEGFLDARSLAKKFVTLYELSSELLSNQVHYDWGLRSVKSVLKVAGMIKRRDSGVQSDVKSESVILMRSLRDFNTPKIIGSDLSIFLRLVADIFPALDAPPKRDEFFLVKLQKVCQRVNAVPDDQFIKKISEFSEILEIRHSVMLLGPAGSGKSSVWKTLASYHNDPALKPQCVFETINPKSLTSNELYGYMTLSKDWKDGALSGIMRNMSKNISPYSANHAHKWIVLDGDIDSVWIESMNSVMDDNKVLTLVSNERIPLTPSMRMIFEISSLKNATPATVSRAGIIFVDENVIGWKCYVERWASEFEPPEKGLTMKKFFDKYVGTIAAIISDNKLQGVAHINTPASVQTICCLMDGFIAENPLVGDEAVLENVFLYSAVWAFGGVLDEPSKARFSGLWYSAFPYTPIPKTNQDQVFNYFYNAKTKTWALWNTRVPEFSPMGEISFTNIVVPTEELVKLSSFVDSIAKRKRPVLLVGQVGTGKTTLMKEWLKNNEEFFNRCTINCNYFTDSEALQKQLEEPIEKRTGRIYGPPGTKNLMYFIDDLNMPFVEEYGTQTPIALLRQHMDYESWFDRTDLGLKKVITNVQFIAAMNHKAGSFFIDSRLQRHFSVFSCSIPSDKDLRCIYGSIISATLGKGFNDSVNVSLDKSLEATLELFKVVSEKFLPTAVTFHYNFNMRDLTSIFQGLSLAKPSEFTTATSFARLWLHECYRVLGDRMVTEIDIRKFESLIVDVSKKYFQTPHVEQAELHASPLLFATFISDTKIYSAVPSGPAGKTLVSDILETKLSRYNDVFTVMNLVLFDEAVAHICRTVRILERQRGNALLVGVGGSGKQSLCKLACYICEMTIASLNISSSFSFNDLRDFLKDLYQKAGVSPAKPICWLVPDSHIFDEKFLVYVNDILSSGYIPDLFTKEEFDSILSSNAVKVTAKALGVPDTKDAMTAFFIDTVRRNLHIVISLSPVGSLFRTRARRFPGIINCTSIDWYHPWSKDALVSVSTRFLDDAQFPDNMSSEVKENLAHHMADVHISSTQACVTYFNVSRRHNNTTPKSYLELIALYKSLLVSKGSAVRNAYGRLSTGLTTLTSTAKDVEVMQETLKVKMREVDEKRLKVDALLEDMGKQRGEATEKQVKADSEKKKAEAAALVALKLQKEAEAELSEATPAMERAAVAVECLDKASLTELKGFTKPPQGVDKVTTAVLMMKGERSDYTWEAAKKMMSKVDAFKTSLEQYDAQNISQDVLDRVAPILADPNFNPKTMSKKSAAAANLCNWVINIIQYNTSYTKVKPLMLKLKEAQDSMKAAQNELNKAVSIVEDCNQRLAELQARYVSATDEKAVVTAAAKTCKDRLALAERLVNGLASEKIRWGDEVEVLKQNQSTLVGDCMLAASFASYIGAFNSAFRESLWKDVWLADIKGRDIPAKVNLDPLMILADESKFTQWQYEGLPGDRVSLENGAIVNASKRWPLLIDPQLQGVKWLVAHEEGKNRPVNVLQFTTHHWLKFVTNAVQNGGTVIIENVGEELHSSLDSVLSRAIYRKGPNFFIDIGGEELEYDSNFRLFLQTRLNNPQYKPEIAAQCTLVNFTVTETGMEDQLLAQVVLKEQPDLEAEKTAIQKKLNGYKMELINLEDALLAKLADAPEDILGDVALIESLEATKKVANEVNRSVLEAREAEHGIDIAREVYRPVGSEGSMLYFIITELQGIDHMYQYSLDSFMVVFLKALAKTPPQDSRAERVEALRRALRLMCYNWVSRGMFEEHKLVFLSIIAFQLLKRGIIGEDCGYTPEYMEYLLRCPKNMSVVGENTLPWLPPLSWAACDSLSSCTGFERIATDIVEGSARFQEWYNYVSPEDEKLPSSWSACDKIPFKKLLIVRALRPDRMTIAITKFIKDILPEGPVFTDGDAQLSSYDILHKAYEDTTPSTPVYFILSPGVDVVADVEKYALSLGKMKGKNYHNISLGQGQEKIAEAKLDVAHKEGHWVLLQNLHLMPTWLGQLEKKLATFQAEKSHKDFRLFVTSDPSRRIPSSILQRSTKLTNEPPSGVKANLKRSFATFVKDEFDIMENRQRSVLFGLAYFHSIMVERKKFGASGFNMVYHFGVGDLKASATVLGNYLDSGASKVPWEDLRYIIGEIIYGGHIVNDVDRTLCMAYLEFFMKDELFEEMEMIPFTTHSKNNDDDTPSVSFKAPLPLTYDNYLQYIDSAFHGDSPLPFGLHPNTEMGFRQVSSEKLFEDIVNLQPRTSSDSGAGAKQSLAERVTQDILENFGGSQFDEDAVVGYLSEDPTPFQVVWLQECRAMNILLNEMMRSLGELELGFRGDLVMSDAMDRLMVSLYNDKVPTTWKNVSYPSNRGLGSWVTDLQLRISQLNDVVGKGLALPPSTWIAGLFNPQRFLTAVMQTTARNGGFELDKLGIITEITKKEPNELDTASSEGAYVHGLYMEGARWDGPQQAIQDAKPKELYSKLPVVLLKSVPVERGERMGVYKCPVYRNRSRGPTYIFTALIKTKAEASKWVMAGVACIMDVA
jgi:dynein heavy chain